MLRYGVGQDRLPWEVLDAEIGIVSKLGAAFHLGEPAFDGPALLKLRDTFDAVLLATGPTQAGKPLISGLAMAGQGVKVDRRTLATNLPGFFAAGAVVTPTRHAVRSVAAGRLAALGIVSSLTGASVVAVEREFTVRMGKVEGVELDRFMATAVDAPRAVVSADRGLDLTSALTEANRCMHCDCRKKQTCSLRDFAIEYAVDPRAYAGERREFEQDLSDSRIVFEPGKCIACGICVHVAGDGPIGLAFNGRGFHVRVTTPFHASLSDALGDRAGECVESCPTGALAWR
jgi:ferredoxin